MKKIAIIDFLTKVQFHGRKCAICGKELNQEDIETSIIGPNHGDEISHADCYERYLATRGEE